MPKPSRKSKRARAPKSQGSGAKVESIESPRRRSFSAEYKRRIVMEANTCTEVGGVGDLLRREGLYSSHLSKWRHEFEVGGTAALAGKKPGRKPKKTADQRRIEQLEKDKAKLEHELYVARALLDLQKKVAGLLAITQAATDSNDGS